LNKIVSTKNSLFSGVLIAFAGVFLFSAKAIIVKLCYLTYHIDSISMLTLRMGMALPFYLIIGFWKRDKEATKLSKKDLIMVIALGFLGYYGASYLDFEGLQHIDASLERLILFSYPTVVVLLGAFWYKRKISFWQIFAILVTYVGILIIFLPVFWTPNLKYNWLGVGLIIGSSITYGSYLVASEHFVPKLGTIRFTTLAMTVSCSAVLIHYLVSPSATVIDLEPKLYLYGFIIALFCTVLPSYFISEGIRRIGSAKVGILGSVGPVATILLSVLILNETLTIYQVIGGSVIISAVVWLNYKKE
jgi:drug/metabolite transporter (DMT)-like permease